MRGTAVGTRFVFTMSGFLSVSEAQVVSQHTPYQSLLHHLNRSRFLFFSFGVNRALAANPVLTIVAVALTYRRSFFGMRCTGSCRVQPSTELTGWSRGCKLESLRGLWAGALEIRHPCRGELLQVYQLAKHSL